VSEERLVLASSSPRRRQLLVSLGVPFESAEPGVDELRLPDEEPYDYVERIARAKAAAVSGPGKLVLAADTTVVLEGQILGKPRHPEEAKAMLRRLSGKTNEVLTAVALSQVTDQVELRSEVVSALVRFLPLTEEEIAEYVDSGEPMDKAGAYALNGRAAIYVESVQGSPTGVIGLPLHVVARLLRNAGLDLFTSIDPARQPTDLAGQDLLGNSR
jgi:septum formation protein